MEEGVWCRHHHGGTCNDNILWGLRGFVYYIIVSYCFSCWQFFFLASLFSLFNSFVPFIPGFWIQRNWWSIAILSPRTSWSGQRWKTCVHREIRPSRCHEDDASHNHGSLYQIPRKGIWEDIWCKVCSLFNCCKEAHRSKYNYPGCAGSGKRNS